MRFASDLLCGFTRGNSDDVMDARRKGILAFRSLHGFDLTLAIVLSTPTYNHLTHVASAVTFGSIDDAAATISSSPASVPPIKTEVPKAFGSVSATPSPISTVNGKQPASSSASVSSTVKPSTHHVTKPAAFNVKSLFMTHSSGPAPSAPSSSQSASDSAASASPSTRPAPLPSYPSSSQPPSHTPQSAQFPSHSFQTFVPGSGLRPQPNGNNTNGPPRSPVYSRPSPNGVAPPVGVNGRPQGPPGTPAAPPTPLSANMPSPRMGHPHAAAPPQMPPGQQPVPWSYYVSSIFAMKYS